MTKSSLEKKAYDSNPFEVVKSKATVEPPGQPVPNAETFIKTKFGHPERDLIVFQGGVFYRWNGSAWPEIDDHALRSDLYSFFADAVYIDDKGDQKDFGPNRYKVSDLMDAMKGISHIPTNTVTPHWFLGHDLPASEMVACDNGLVHIPTRKLYTHTPNYYQHHAVSFEFDPKAPAPAKWLAFLNDLWGDDDESKAALQEVFGYLLTGDTTLQKMFLLVGPKRSGKGTIARIIRRMLGEHNVAGPTLAGLGTNFGLSPMIGKPVAVIADARLKNSDTSIVTERLLSISGEDMLTVDRKYKEPWTGQIPSRILILSNELPRLADSSGALASRFIVLMMQNSFYGRENPNLTAALCAGMPGIFNWALDGLERLRERGYFLQPQASQEAIKELEDLGSPIGAFIRDECVTGPEYEVSCDDLYRAWKNWCEDHGRHATSTQVFGRDLRAVYPSIRCTRPRQDDGSRLRMYAGIGLVRSGPRPTPMYYQQRQGDSSNNNEVDRGPSRTSTQDDGTMPTRSEIFAAAKEVCTEIDLDPSELTDFIVARGDPIQACPIGIRSWALKIAKDGYPA